MAWRLKEKLIELVWARTIKEGNYFAIISLIN